MDGIVQDVIDFAWGPVPIRWVQAVFDGAWLPFFGVVTALGEPEAVAVGVAVVLWGRGRAPAYGLLTVVVLAVLLNGLLKGWFAVPRPDDPGIVVYHEATRASFPSGHSATAGALWGGLIEFGRAPPVVAAAAVVLVMLSRLYLGVHFLGDVVVGALLGLALVSAYGHLWPAIHLWFVRRPFRFLVAVAAAASLLALVAALRFPFGWELFGATLGAAAGELVEYRCVRYRPGHGSLRVEARKWVIGLGGVAAILGAEALVAADGPIVEALTLGLVALWLVLGAPAVFVRLGLTRREAPASAS